MLDRKRPVEEYAPLYRKYGLGTTVFSALAGGLLTGKYNDGVPAGSRFEKHGELPFIKQVVDSFGQEEGQKTITKLKELAGFAEKELGCGITHLALAWVAANPNTSTVILGASKPEQVLDNLKAIEVLPKLTPDVLEKIEKILGNKPAPPNTFGRAPLDAMGRKWY
jgi:aryl-alcohol dehydrogenase-like predicted oxidoreductase